MSLAICVTPLSKCIPVIQNAHYIGVDAGALKVIEQNLKLDFAIGDFDSIDSEKLSYLKTICPVYQFPVMKDETDSELAILKCYEQFDRVILFGALTGRLDHTFLNIRLMEEKFNDLILLDETQRVRLFKKGKYILKNEYKNISFFVLEPGFISLRGFLYTLDHRMIHKNDLYLTSNSFIHSQGMVEVHSGSFLCIESNEK
ncbi:thiamine diphosphokinase [Floccifex sp.]|uniref:thiamine diphosphokinase n=1 Tax=Floccifex sp. TaxID=2815810 RepID=UPI003EFFA0FA